MFEDAQPGPRLPFYILVDRSGSLDGEAMRAMNEGLRLLVSDLESEPRAVQTVWISLISFGDGARVDVPLTGLDLFHPPSLQASGSPTLGAALRLLNDSLDTDVIQPSATVRGDYRPFVLIFVATNPADEWREPARLLRERTHPRVNVVVVACGSEVNEPDLTEITDSVLRMEEANAGSLLAHMSWMEMGARPATMSEPPPSGTPQSAPTPLDVKVVF